MIPSDDLNSLIDEACGSFSFITTKGRVRLTYDFKRLYNKLILAKEWK